MGLDTTQGAPTAPRWLSESLTKMYGTQLRRECVVCSRSLSTAVQRTGADEACRQYNGRCG